MLLDSIKKENDIKNIGKKDYPALAGEIREFLLDKVSENGGHLASNLGAVELTMALHLCMDFPEDKLIFDVGHQAYTHKLLTGRKEEFDTLRQFGGMSGFPKRAENASDAFDTGHSSTSISAAMGYAKARDLKHGNEKVACVIGDGSMTGGMVFEALNGLSQMKTSCVVILNDNEMSIDKNVGGLSKYLNNIRVGSAYNDFKSGVENSLLSTKTGSVFAQKLKKSKDNIKHMFVPGMFFEELGITYVGPIDGHNINEMVSTFKKAFQLKKPIIIHVKTKKGQGYRLAEKHPESFHGVAPFDKTTGKPIVKKETSTYTDIFGKHLVDLAKDNDNIVAITAAMANGTGLNRFAAEYPERFFDVGIAEQHGVTFAAGLAAAGMTPVVAIYSSFLQRAYDQILHDVCLQNLHVVFAIDRSGLVGNDGETHQGIYDISYLSHMPNMIVMAPKNRYELMAMMEFAINYNGPCAIKYPRGSADKHLQEFKAPIELGKSEWIYEGKRVAIIACGNAMGEALRLVDIMREDGYEPSLINARFLSDIDKEMLDKVCNNSQMVITMEENVIKGGYGEKIAAALLKKRVEGFNVMHLNAAIPVDIVQHGSIGELRAELSIDAESIYKRMKEVFI